MLNKWHGKPSEGQATKNEKLALVGFDDHSSPIQRVAGIIPLILKSLLKHIFKTFCPHITKPGPRSFRFDVGVTMHPIVLQGSTEQWIQFLTDGGLSVSDIVVFSPTVTLRQHWNTFQITVTMIALPGEE